MDKFPLEGLKLRCGLCKVDVSHPYPPEGLVADFFQLLAGNRINLDILIGRRTDGRMETAFVTTTEAGRQVKSLTHSDPLLSKSADFRDSVCLLSMFPHKADLRVLGLSLIAFSLNGISLHGFCSSLSALTFITNPTMAERTLSALGACFELPKGAGIPSEG